MFPLDETRARRTGFVVGPTVRLADGRDWSLPLREPGVSDREYDALLALIDTSEDRNEALRAELALTIFLLLRNYDLPPDAVDFLLRFAPGDRALAVLQAGVHEVACESARRLKSGATTALR